MQAMPQLTDRSKLPTIVDAVIKDTMDLKHLYQVCGLENEMANFHINGLQIKKKKKRNFLDINTVCACMCKLWQIEFKNKLVSYRKGPCICSLCGLSLVLYHFRFLL